MEDAVTRFNAALENLNAALERRKVTEDSLTQLEEDLHLMALDRAQLARRLDEAVAKTKTAWDFKADLTQRLDTAIATVDGLIAEAEAA